MKNGSIHLFKLSTKMGKIKHYSITSQIHSAYVLKTEEKGSDVNLATHLLFDSFKDDFETAVVISNDSDLFESIRLSIALGKKVGIINPHKNPSRKLTQIASFVKKIREGALKESQFPDDMRDEKGDFHKPETW